MRLKLTTTQDLKSRLFRFQVAMALAVIAATFVLSAVYPNASLGFLIMAMLVWRPGSDYPTDVYTAATGPILIGASMGPAWSRSSLVFDLAIAVIASLVLAAMGLFIARSFIRDFNKREPQAPPVSRG